MGARAPSPSSPPPPPTSGPTGPVHWEGAARSPLPGAQGGGAQTPRADSGEDRATGCRPGQSQTSQGSEHPRPLRPQTLGRSITEHGHCSALSATSPLGGVHEQPRGSLGGQAGLRSGGPLAPAGSSCPAASGHRCRPHKTARGSGRPTRRVGNGLRLPTQLHVYACLSCLWAQRTPTHAHVHPCTHRPVSLGAAWDPGLPWGRCRPPGSSAAAVSTVDPARRPH